MSIRLACPGCGKRFTISDSLAGKRCKCSGCGAALTVPQVAPPPIAGARCPACQATLLGGAVLCTRCGYDFRTGRRISSAPREPSRISQRHVTAAVLGGLLLLIIAGVALLTHGIGREIRRVQSDMQKASAPLADAQYGPQSFVFPARPQARPVAPGVEFYSMTLSGSGPGLPMQVYLYLPAGAHAAKSLACVFIAPAGSRLLHGMRLGESDMPEHLPYAARGFAVLAYELSGDLPDEYRDRPTLGQLAGPIKEFMAVDGGLANAHVAIEYVLKQVPEVDPNRLYTAGHSSAATMALNLAAADPRIRGCCAYAPMCDVETDWRLNLGKMERLVPGVTDFTARLSPIRHVAEISCPVFLFHAEDDTRVPLRDNLAFDAAMAALHKRVQFVRAGRGGHFESMMREGIPSGITWLESLRRQPTAPDNVGGRIHNRPPLQSPGAPPAFGQPTRVGR